MVQDRSVGWGKGMVQGMVEAKRGERRKEGRGGEGWEGEGSERSGLGGGEGGELKGGTLGEKRGRERQRSKTLKLLTFRSWLRFSIKSDFRRARFHFDEVHKRGCVEELQRNTV